MEIFDANPLILEETVRGIQPIQIEDELLRRREIFLTSEVNAETASALFKQLLYLERQDPGAPVTLYISSPGGQVDSGMAVYDLIRLMRSPVRTVCIGLAASMGSILFLAGDTRAMLPDTRLMIHDPSFGGGNMTGKKPLQLQKELEGLMQIREVLTAVIAERTGLSVEQVREMTAEDTYLTARRSLELGLATEIITRGES